MTWGGNRNNNIRSLVISHFETQWTYLLYLYLYMFNNIPANHADSTVLGLLSCTGLWFVTFTTAPAEFSTEPHWSDNCIHAIFPQQFVNNYISKLWMGVRGQRYDSSEWPNQPRQARGDHQNPTNSCLRHDRKEVDNYSLNLCVWLRIAKGVIHDAHT